MKKDKAHLLHEAIMQGQRNVMVGIRNNDIVYVPFSECIRTDKRFDKRLITVLDELSIQEKFHRL